MTNSSTWRKFKILLWKGMMIRKRRWICSLVELVFPIIGFLGYALVVPYTKDIPEDSIVKAQNHPKIDTNELNSHFNLSTKLCYYPTVGFTKEIIKKVQSKLKLRESNVLDFKNESNFLEYFMKSNEYNSIFVVAFQELTGSSVPQKFVYLIRPYFENIHWNTAILMNDVLAQQYNPNLGSNNYIKTGFLSLQIALEISFIEIATRKTLPFDIVVQEFPYPQRISEPGDPVFFGIFFTLLAYSFVCTFQSTLAMPPIDKGTGINELMKTTGLSSWLIFLSWYFYHITANIISILLILLIIMVPIHKAEEAIVKHSHFSLLFFFLFLYCSSMIIMGLMVASRFDSEVFSIIVGIIIWMVLLSVTSDIKIKSHKLKLFASIVPTIAGHYICEEIGMYEFRGIGVHWSNIHKTAQENANDVTILEGLIMLFVGCIIFSILSLYIEQLYPGRYGVAKPYNYIIIYYKPFWKKAVQPNKVDSEINLVSDNLSKTEPPAPTLKPGIRIQNLRKRYGTYVAVNNLSMDFYEGLITVLLGQNGAGKTTAMSIITGMIKPTSGTVFVHGEDIKYNLDKIRYSLGYCPQNDINFDDLKVIDHFIFFGMLKGHNKKKARSQARALLTDLNLYHQRKKRAKELSGGMKRRLSLGIALMGNSKILILDEPTSGLDPETRRELWDILLKLRSSHMIIITTHFMEEAEALADRIAIMDHGHLTCYGSPIFLKKMYGSGYRLTITRDKKLFEERNPGKNHAETITAVIQGKLKEASLLESNLNCFVYLLPYDKKSQYTAVLDEIENKKDALCVSHTEMSVTTLEEVFLKSGKFVVKEDTKLKFDLQSSALQDKKSKLWKLKLNALIEKRWLILKKRYLMFLISFLLVISICIEIFHLSYTTTKKNNKKQLKFDIQLYNYGRTTVYYSSNKKFGYFKKMMKKYDKLVEEQGSDAYQTDDDHREILHKGENNFKFYRKEMIVAAEFIEEKTNKCANAMFSNPSLHGAVISINLLTNSILHTLKNENHSITGSISPLPDNKFRFNLDDQLTSDPEFDQLQEHWTILFPDSLTILVFPFIILPRIENVSKFKQLQLMCGVHPLLYWGVFYIMDLLFYLIWIFVIILIMLIYQNSTNGLFLFDQTAHCGTLTLMFVVYGMPVIPYIYLFSYINEVFNCISLYITLNLIIIPVFRQLVVLGSLPEWLNYLFAVYPQYGLLYLFDEFFFNNAIAKNQWSMIPKEVKVIQCKKHRNPCCDDETSKQCFEFSISQYGKTDATIKYIMLLSTFAYFAILLLLDKQYLQKFYEMIRLMICREVKSTEKDEGNREDVKLQEERISEIMDRELKDQEVTASAAEDTQNVLLVNKLQKTYKRVKVVKQISFSVDEGECFGLLGVNGAGKTTTFRMLTGNLPLLKGDCRILSPSGKRFFLSKTSKKYFSNIGYCPQVDVSEEVLTGREILTFFGKLRGISQGLDKEIENFAKCLAFEEVLNKPCGNYSGGNKRKLSIAVALIGLPSVILLDEPTSGVDPISRRAMWNTIQMAQNQSTKPAIVLTSHSMEECEILCNKIAIMKAGKFHCYGTLAQLKSKYSEGFAVTLKLAGGDDVPQQEKLKNLKLKFKQLYKDNCYLKDEEATSLQYRITDLGKKWSEIFKNMEQLQKEFPIIEDYIIAETTLEQVFLKIAQSS